MVSLKELTTSWAKYSMFTQNQRLENKLTNESNCELLFEQLYKISKSKLLDCLILEYTVRIFLQDFTFIFRKSLLI